MRERGSAMMRMAVWLAVVAVSVWPGCTAARGKVIAQALADVAKQSAMVLIGHVERGRGVASRRVYILLV